MSWQTPNERNALESAIWGVVLAAPLVQQHQKAILANDGAFTDILTQKSFGAQITVQMESTGNIVLGGNADDQPARLSYRSVAADGTTPLQMSIAGSTIAITNNAYEGWSNDKSAALDLFAQLSGALSAIPELPPISHLELAYKDVFWWDGEWESACLNGLLARGTKWTPDWVFETTSLWHHDIGEIVDRGGASVVERLAIHCAGVSVGDAPRMGVTMNTMARWLGPVPRDVLPVNFHAAFGSERDATGGWFDTLHDAAKQMFAGSLAKPMRERLGV